MIIQGAAGNRPADLSADDPARRLGLGRLLLPWEARRCGRARRVARFRRGREVAAELLAGAEGEVAERMWETLSSLPWVELDTVAWRQVGATARRLGRAGQTQPLTDLAIAVAAARAGHALWAVDGDFRRIQAALDGLHLQAVNDWQTMLRAEAARADVGSVRTEGARAFVIYRGLEGKPYAISMAREGGAWKVASLSGLALS